MPIVARFATRLFRYPGKGGWHFATVPKRYAPSRTLGWGRAPVIATVDGHRWRTSVWKTQNGRALLAVPKTARGTKGDGDRVTVEIEYLGA